MLSSSLLQFDGDRTHRTPAVLRYLTTQGLRYIEDWPARSPDLSPIENVLALVQREVDRRGPAEAHELEEFVRDVFGAIPTETINAMVLSFEGRLQRVIASRGATILTKGATQE